MFIVYDPLSGMIQQTISGPGEGYGETYLAPRNLTWTFLRGAMTVNPVNQYIDVATKSLKDFAPMALSIDKQTFFADGDDVATVSGIPSGSSALIFCEGIQLSSLIVNDSGKVEIVAASPGEYSVRCACAKHLAAEVTFRAVPAAPKMTVDLDSLK